MDADETFKPALVECERCGSTEFCLETDGVITFATCRQCDRPIGEVIRAKT